VSVVTLAVFVVLLAGTGFTEWRLWQGMDLRDESYYVVVPYRFSVGDTPFVDETSILQIPGLLMYPLVKPFVALQGGHANGIIMYTRHLYLLFMLAVAGAAFVALRRLLTWQQASLVALLYVTFLLIARPQLSYNTMGYGFLTLGVAFGLLFLVGKGKQAGSERAEGRTAKWLVAAGVMHGLAAFAFATFWIVPIVFALFLGLTLRARRYGEAASVEGSVSPHCVLRAVAAYCCGAAVVLAAETAVVLSFGWTHVLSDLRSSYAGGQTIGQVGGWPKLVAVLNEFAGFFWGRPYFLAAGLALYLVFRRWPAVGRMLLILLPLPLYMAGNYYFLEEGGFAIVFVFLAPFLYVFGPSEHKRAAKTLLLWAVVPSLVAGVIAAWTSADGYAHAAVGLAPAFMASGAYLVWAVGSGWASLQSRRFRGDWIGRHPSVPVTVVLVALVGITIVYQFQFIARYEPYSHLTAWVSSGPFWGVHTNPERKAYLEQLASDLQRYTTPKDRLLVDTEFPAAYLFWPYRIATNSVWIASPLPTSPLPAGTIAWMRAHHTVPDVVLRTQHTGNLSNAQYLKLYGLDLGYVVALRRPDYVLLRRPPGAEPLFLGDIGAAHPGA
jgi:hypothetical protein